MKRSLCAPLLLCGAVALVLGGCSGQKGGIKGTVTMDSHPLDHAEVEFLPADSKRMDAALIVRTDDKGEFDFVPGRRQKGLKPGKYYVRITKWVDKKTGKVPEADMESGQDAEQLKLAGKLKNIVPQRYSATDNLAGLLTAEIKGDGSDNLKLDVKAK